MTAQAIFKSVVDDHAAPWLAGRGYHGSVTKAEFRRRAGDFELSVSFWKSRRSTRFRIDCEIHGGVRHVPSFELAARLNVLATVDDLLPRPFDISVISPERVTVQSEHRQFATVNGDQPVQDAASHALSELEQLLDIMDSRAADPGYRKGVVVSRPPRLKTPSEPFAPTAGYEDYMAAILDESEPVNLAALHGLGRQISSLFAGLPHLRDQWMDRPEAEIGSRRLVDWALDHPDPEVRGVAEALTYQFRIAERVTADSSWWATTANGLVTCDGRSADNALLVTRSRDRAKAAAKLGIVANSVFPLAEAPDPQPPPHPPGGVYWRHPDDTDLPIWHRGGTEDWDPARLPADFNQLPPTLQQRLRDAQPPTRR